MILLVSFLHLGNLPIKANQKINSVSYLESSTIEDYKTYNKLENLIINGVFRGKKRIEVTSLQIDTFDFNFFDFTSYSPYLSNGVSIGLNVVDDRIYVDIETKMSNEQLKNYFLKIKAKTQEILLGVKSNSTDLDKALYIHDYLCSNAEYSDFGYDAYNSAGIIYYGKGVCQSYAFAYSYLMNLLGIDCLVTKSDSMFHAWNIIKIGEKYYHVDPTFNDALPDMLGNVGHEYFLLSDSAIKKKNHDGWDTKIKCSSTKYDSFFWKNVNSPIVFDETNYYYIVSSNDIYNANSKLIKRNKKTNSIKQLTSISAWPMWGLSGSYWLGAFSGLSIYNGQLYFNTYKSIDKISTSGKNKVSILNPSVKDGYVVGSRIHNGYLEYQIKKDINDNSKNIKKSSLNFKGTAKKIILMNNQIILKAGEKDQIYAKAIPSYANYTSLNYSSSNPKVVTVSASGKIDAISTGNATITLATSNGIKMICKVTVNKNPFFADVSEDKWYYNTIKEVHRLGLMTGTSEGVFEPNSSMTRGMVATVLYRMVGNPYVKFEPLFNDVKPDAYYSKAVTWAAKNGIISGYGNKKFGPKDKISRQQMMVMLRNFAKYKKINVNVKQNLSKFKDYNKIASYAKIL